MEGRRTRSTHDRDLHRPQTRAHSRCRAAGTPHLSRCQARVECPPERLVARGRPHTRGDVFPLRSVHRASDQAVSARRRVRLPCRCRSEYWHHPSARRRARVPPCSAQRRSAATPRITLDEELLATDGLGLFSDDTCVDGETFEAFEKPAVRLVLPPHESRPAPTACAQLVEPAVVADSKRHVGVDAGCA